MAASDNRDTNPLTDTTVLKTWKGYSEGIDSEASALAFMKVVEAWERYTAATESEASVLAFIQWIRKNDPDILRVAPEPVVVSIAKEFIRRQQTRKTAA